MPDEAALDRFVRVVCVLFAASSFPLAAWIAFHPDAFFATYGVGGNPFVQALYGGAIAGEGVMFALGAREPARYRVFFEYMTVYKTLAVLFGARVWLASDARGSGALAVLGGWAVAGLVSAVVTFRARRLRAP